MKKYTDLTTKEKLELDSAEFEKSVYIEAISKGIAPPLSLNGVEPLESIGFSSPADARTFYEIVYSDNYSLKHTGLVFTNEAAAHQAMQGALIYEKEYFKSSGNIYQYNLSVNCIKINSSGQYFSTKIDPYLSVSEEYTNVAKECIEDLSKIKQAAYNSEVNRQKKQQYLELAQNNIEIAKAFWNKAESVEWPE